MGTASSIFIVSSVKVPTHTTALITSELNHQLPDQRINAIYRFQVWLSSTQKQKKTAKPFFALPVVRLGINCDIKK